jgi:hypothetical protein
MKICHMFLNNKIGKIACIYSSIKKNVRARANEYRRTQ